MVGWRTQKSTGRADARPVPSSLLTPRGRSVTAAAFARLLLRVALAELVDATAGVKRLLLAGVERMGVARDIHLDQRVLVTVFPLDGFLGGDRRTRQEREVRRQVLEHHRAIIRMDIGLHD